jgi:DNA-binding NarL/FixJ family response regulator
MIDFLTDAIDNALKVTSDLFDPYATLDRRSVAKLIADGLTVAAIASAFGVAEDVITNILSE